jgi:hypothetical protein
LQRLQPLLPACVSKPDDNVVEIVLQETEERLWLTQSVAGIGIWDWDIVHNQVTFNTQYY